MRTGGAGLIVADRIMPSCRPAHLGWSSLARVIGPWGCFLSICPGASLAILAISERLRRAATLPCRLHYADTLKAWRDRFLARREEAQRLYDERFCRMWEFYLAASEMTFRDGGMMVLQIQMSKREGVVPTTRDYIARDKARLRGIETGRRPRLRLAGG